ncbi:hypothetical protein GMLC_44520 [Geomonas limicola]|uniref:Protein O-GlcNAc transferase n=1 Tax=Geomonas limicola TaxID=2740186 RepID=A0A6V8NGV4_9BACT|nr:tetratricopeptide repeat protein [Geomonas limicola]GFO70873.1 hypothetical protein GMLC_44520 [Geomonas limicola]
MVASAAAQQQFARALDLHREGSLEEAAELYRAVAASGSAWGVDAQINLGVILHETGRYGEAFDVYRAALEARQDDPVALNNLGNTLLALGRFAEAAKAYGRALEKAPESRTTRIALGAAWQREGELTRAEACFREALARDPEDAEAHWNLALALLAQGEFAEGWREYQWRWRRDSFTSPRRGFACPAWDGTPLSGRRLLVHCEQGLGDTIQFLRYLPLLATAGGEVVLEVQSAQLLPLTNNLPGVSRVCLMGEPIPPCDVQVALLSLPYLFGSTLENLPDRLPYLAAPADRLAPWRARVAERGEGLKVGLVWAGKPTPDPFRSARLADFAPLAGLPGITFFSLQLGEAALHPAPQGFALVDLTGSLADFGDTAALVEQLDLVISVDTSVAHLAGALGKPVWLMLPKAADYRWLAGRDDSPWYPGMRLFRQTRQGVWDDVVERLAGELELAALAAGERLVAATPLDPAPWELCGLILARLGRHREAVLRLNKAALLDPDSYQVHYALAASLKELGSLAEAAGHLERALALKDDLAQLHEALGIVRQLGGEYQVALASYDRSLVLDPAALRSRYNRAVARRELGRFEEALEGFAEVVRLAPEHADAHWNLALMLLVTGRLEEGWREFSWRFARGPLAPVRRFQELPPWDGGELAGRSILVWAEQGLGDTLQFLRYLPLLAERGGTVVLEVQSASLKPLAERVPGVARVLVAGEAPPRCDLQASLLELPALFGTTLDSIPARVPYLDPPPERLAAAAALLPRDGSFKVGLVWAGNPGHENDRNRSLPLELLAPLAGIAGVRYYALQLGSAAVQADQVPELGVEDLSHALGDFADSAALVSQLDLVVTVDTSMAHLCGALGVPAWVLVPFIPDWRWLVGCETSPWYPSLRLFRQKRPGSWQEPVLRLHAALKELARPVLKAPAPEGTPLPARTALLEQGVQLSEAGRFTEAARVFRQLLALDPDDADVLNNLGCALDNAGRPAEALVHYRRAIELRADFCAPHYNMGNSLRSLGEGASALGCYQRALAIEPELPQGWHNLALALQDLGRLEEAQQALERAVHLHPGYLEARHTLGELLHNRGDLARAAATFEEVVARDAGFLPSWNALGITRMAQERLDDAVQCYREALKRNPEYLHALNNLGATCRALGDLAGARDCYLKVLACDPQYADAHWNLALVELQLGDYPAGWLGYEWRFKKVDPIPLKEFPRPLWDGGPLAGKTILLHAEQGFGDTIQFVRYATLVAGRGARVLVQCQSPPIAKILESVPGVSRVLVRGEALPDFDCHAPLMSLPLLSGTTLDSVPAQVPYLAPDPGLLARWGERIAESQAPAGKLRVGLVWAGRPTYQDDARRSLSLKLFAPLARLGGVSFYALQVGPGAEQAAQPPAGMELADLGSRVHDFSDSAAIVAHLDLVISADTALAHLAGALGKPVWVLLPKACDWRWLTGRTDSPWYPTARLFRQSERGDWAGVLERVAQALNELVAGPGEPGRTAGLDEPPCAPELAPLNAALAAGDLVRAAGLCQALLAQHPDHVELLTLAGALARGRGDSPAALPLFERAARFSPGLPELHNNLGVVLEDLGRHDQALVHYRRALELKPDYPEGHCNLGNALKGLGRSEEACAAYRRALELQPRYPEAYYNLGNALRCAGEWPEAAACYRALLELDPEHLSGWLNLGGSLLTLNRYAEAEEVLRRALHIAPDCREAHWNLGQALLAQGKFRAGWPEYEWRLKDMETFPAYCIGKPRWDGGALDGRTLLLRAEQGFGDALQFFRFVPLLVERGADLVLECRRELLPLFAAQGLPVRCFAVGDPAPPFDTFAYLMSLPNLLGIAPENLPAAPYLRAEPALAAQWRAHVPHDGLKVGIIWSGSSLYQGDPYRFRSLSRELLEPLTLIPGVQLIGLQPEPEAAGAGICQLGSRLRHFGDTAALIANLDLVVSIDTALAHLAGALGVPTLLLLPWSCDWRWPAGRDHSPWYPSLRLYRQEAPGDWGPVLEALCGELARLAAAAGGDVPPPDPNRLFAEANALSRAGDLDAAVLRYRELLELCPDHPEVLNNLGLVLQDQGALDEAASCYRAALGIKPDLADAWNNLGTVLVTRDDRPAALDCFEEALALNPHYLPAYANLGSALQHLELPDRAVEIYRRALAIDPENPQVLVNLGNAYQELREPEAAVRAYRQALALDPESAEAHWNLALSLLSLGDFAHGWREYEWRFAAGAPAPVSLPRWDGGALEGRRILLWCEQGLGDTLHFVRYAAQVAERGGRVFLRCQAASLKPLLECIPGISGVYAPGEALPPLDCQFPLLSLPQLFGTTLEKLPGPVPYLCASLERVIAWRDRLASPARLKVGLIWRGGPLPKNRACPYEAFGVLAGLTGVQFFSLQLGEVPDAHVLPARELGPEIRDFADSAAIMAQLDLVISVDTAGAHLAGALGVPTWLILPWSCDWRWQLAETASPWYPSLRLFRQERPGDWPGLLATLRVALEELAETLPQKVGNK